MKALSATLLVCVGLAGCRSFGAAPDVVPVDVAAAEAAQTARAQALGLAAGQCAEPAWAMTGRAALSNGKDGGSGRVEWTQAQGRVQVTLSAPITRQSWTLTRESGYATLEGVPNGPLRGADAGALLRMATGWDIPVEALGCWLRGVAAARAGDPAPVIAYGPDLLPIRLEQRGWVVEYGDWKPDAVSGLPMPGRVFAQRGEDRVRLLVDGWGAD